MGNSLFLAPGNCMPSFSEKLLEEVCRERPDEDQIASSYLRCGSLKDGTLRGMEKVDMVVRVYVWDKERLLYRRRGLFGVAHWREVLPRDCWPWYVFVEGERKKEVMFVALMRSRLLVYARCRGQRDRHPWLPACGFQPPHHITRSQNHACRGNTSIHRPGVIVRHSN